MTTVKRIFERARLTAVTAADKHVVYFDGLHVGSLRYYGQIIMARVDGMGSQWAVTIYILVNVPSHHVATGFQARAETLAAALEQAEQYTTDWAAAQEVKGTNATETRIATLR